MAASPAKVPVSRASDSSLLHGNRLDDDVRDIDQLIQSTACHRIAAGVDHNRSLEKAACRYPADLGLLDC